MVRYALGRLSRAALTLFGVLSLCFLLLHLAGSPSALMLPPSASAGDIAALDHRFGYDRSLGVQYLSYLAGTLRGDFGLSLRQGAPALTLVLQHMPATLELAGSAFVLGAGSALGLALAIHVTRLRGLRLLVFWMGLTRQAIPNLVFAIGLVALFSVALGWLPSMGQGSWRSLVLPALTIASFETTLYVRLLDDTLSEQGRLDYVRTAFAKGASRWRVVTGHMLPNALLPVLTVAGLNLGAMLGGMVVVETVFDWPGVGRLVVESISVRDFPVVQAGLLLFSAIIVAINFGVELVCAAIDPRVALR